jgi:hypothetical protein
MKRSTQTDPGLQTVNGVTKLGGQYIGHASTVPIAAAFAASLASGAKVGTQSGGADSALVWPAQNPGVA